MELPQSRHHVITALQTSPAMSAYELSHSSHPSRLREASSSWVIGGSEAQTLRFRGYFEEPSQQQALYPRDPTPHPERVRRVELRYHLGAEGKAGELEMKEIGSQQTNAGVTVLTGELPPRLFRDVQMCAQPLLSRRRVLMSRGGERVPSLRGEDGLPLAFYQHACAQEAEVRMDARALLGLRRVHAYEEGLSAGLMNMGATNLTRKLHWPALPDAQFLQPEELYPGAKLSILGKEIHIVESADEQTHGWLALMGLPTKRAVGEREDPHLAHLRRSEEREAAAREAARRTTADNDEIRRRGRNCLVAKPGLREAKHSSGSSVAPLESERARLQRAMLWGGRVVHFYCLSSDKPSEPQRKFTLSYFFADGSVQLVEWVSDNSGDCFANMRLQTSDGSSRDLRGGGLPSDPMSGRRNGGGERILFLKKCRAPKDLEVLKATSPHYAHQRWLARDGNFRSEFIELEDLVIRDVVKILGREFRIVGCEPSSRVFLATNLNIQLAEDEELF